MKPISLITEGMGDVKYPQINIIDRDSPVHFFSFKEQGQKLAFADIEEKSSQIKTNKTGVVLGYGGISTIEYGLRLIQAEREKGQHTTQAIVLADVNHFQKPFWKAFFSFYQGCQNGEEMIERFSVLTAEHSLRTNYRNHFTADRPVVDKTNLARPFLEGDRIDPWYKDPTLFKVFKELLDKGQVGALTISATDRGRFDELASGLKNGGYEVVLVNNTNLLHFYDLGNIPPDMPGFYRGQFGPKEKDKLKEEKMSFLRNMLITCPNGLIVHAHDYPERTHTSDPHMFEMKVETTEEFKTRIKRFTQEGHPGGFSLDEIWDAPKTRYR